MPTLISRIDAPFSICSSAIVITVSRTPSRSSACSFFLPVGLIRSPTTIKEPSKLICLVMRSDDSKRSFLSDISGISIVFAISESALIWAGVVPQQPPTIPAPASMIIFISSAKVSGVMAYTLLPSTSSGIPAFGFANTGTNATSFMAATSSVILSGPVEQFTPIASTPRFCNTLTAVTGSVPYKVLPSSLNVRLAMIGRSQISFAAITAALVSARLIIVSTTRRSQPASTRTLICSL